jgi:hypothetical protein
MVAQTIVFATTGLGRGSVCPKPHQFGVAFVWIRPRMPAFGRPWDDDSPSDSANRRPLLQRWPGRRFVGSLSLSPPRGGSGSHPREDVYVVNADGSGLRRLTDDPGADSIPRDARRRADRVPARGRGRDSTAEIYLMNANGWRQRNLTRRLGRTTRRPSRRTAGGSRNRPARHRFRMT